jgi:hypothetical protein
MAKLPESSNPFKTTAIYKEFGLDPFASEQEIMDQIDEVSSGFASLSDEEKTAKLKTLKQGMGILQDAKKRVQINALMVEQTDEKTVADTLRAVATSDLKSLKLPEPDVTQIVTEGRVVLEESGEAEKIEPLKALGVPLDQIRDTLSNKVLNRNISFDS